MWHRCRTCPDKDDADPKQCTPDMPGSCPEHATCTQVTPHLCACNPASSYRCQCNQGYIGDGLNCSGELQLSEQCAINLLVMFITPKCSISTGQKAY